MTLHASRQFSISDQVLSQEVNGETVLLNLEGEAYFSLNEVGTRIWQLLADGKPLGEIHDILQTQFVVDAERCKSDVDEFVADLLNRNLVRLVN